MTGNGRLRAQAKRRMSDAARNACSVSRCPCTVHIKRTLSWILSVDLAGRHVREINRHMVMASDISPDVFGCAGFQRKLPGLERLKKTAEQKARSQTCPGPEQSNCEYQHFFHKQAATPARLLAHHDNLRCLRVRSFPPKRLTLKDKESAARSRA